MFRPIDTKCWERFLAYKGFTKHSISSSHHQWKKKAAKRPIPVWGNEKQIPAFHLKKGCETVGCTTDELYEWVEKNC